MKKLSLFLVALTMILFSCKPEVEKPTVVTKSVGEVTKTSAKVVGQVAADGGADVTERGVCWSTDGTPTILDFRVKDTEGGLGSYEIAFTDLVPNTQYYVRAYATNEAGTGYGDEKTFVTVDPEDPENPENSEQPEQPEDPENPEQPEGPEEPENPENPEQPEQPENPEEPEVPEQPEEGAPVVTTAEVTDITVNSAKCGGEVVSGGDAVIVARGVCWNTTGAPTVSDTYTMNGTNIGIFTSNLNNLEHNTAYYVRAYATNANGVTSYGKEITFTTLEKLLPTVTTAEVTGIKCCTAVSGGEVTFDGNVTVTARGICWSTSQNPTIEDNKTSNGSGVGSYTSNMTNLEHNTTYYVRAYATNEVGTAYGEEKSFMTLEKLLPTVTTATEVTNITVNSATCGGEVTFNGNVTVTARGICWSTSQNPTIEDNKTSNGSGVGSYTSKMTNLEQNTTYYVRAYATNEVGTAYGEERTFKTLAAYSPATGTSNGYGYVDLGLSVKWATCNVGASKPEDYGNYYAWGETTTKEEYYSSDSPTYGLSISQLQSQGYIDSEGNLTSQYDAATANWGGDWRMPTYDELRELLNNCTWEWINTNGVNGYKVIGPSGASIFLPAAGFRSESSLYSAGDCCYNWSSAPIGDIEVLAGSLYFDSGEHSMYYCFRYVGLSVRSILE